MEDARENAKEFCYPRGLKDGEKGVIDTEFLDELLSKLDVDQYYLYDFCSRYYREGYNRTYAPPTPPPTFLEKLWTNNREFIVSGIGLVGAFTILAFIRMKNER